MGCKISKYSDSSTNSSQGETDVPMPITIDSDQHRRQRVRRGSWFQRSWRLTSYGQHTMNNDFERMRRNSEKRRRSSLGIASLLVKYDTQYDFSGCSKNNSQDDELNLSNVDSIREQKRNELEDFGDNQHLTLEAFNQVDFDFNTMEVPCNGSHNF